MALAARNLVRQGLEPGTLNTRMCATSLEIALGPSVLTLHHLNLHSITILLRHAFKSRNLTEIGVQQNMMIYIHLEAANL